MAKTIITAGSTTFRVSCSECGTYFAYERADVVQNYVRGGEWVYCPLCKHACPHQGNWVDARGGCGNTRCA